MLAIAAPIARGETEAAAEVIDAIAPYLGRLRFHPQPSSRPIAAVSTVHVATIGETRATIARIETPIAVRRMNEALAVWLPLTDRAVDLFAETVVDGEACRAFPEGWKARAAALHADYEAASSRHRLLEELAALAKRAEIELPLVDELAADIFMGGFSAKFVRAAAIAARRLEGTLYAQYYALPTEEVRAIGASLPSKGPVPAFGARCERMAALEPGLGWSVARNGRIIEQQQILTTQNLVPLIDAAGLDGERFPELARASFAWLVRRVQVKAKARIDRLRTAKNAAYAWRQIIAYLSLSPAGAIEGFLAEAHDTVAAQPEPWRTGLASFVEGLENAHAGRTPEVRLLGWTTGPHPLVIA